MRGKVQSFRVRKCKRDIQREKQNTVGLVGREDARRVGKGVGFKMGGCFLRIGSREKRRETSFGSLGCEIQRLGLVPLCDNPTVLVSIKSNHADR